MSKYFTNSGLRAAILNFSSATFYVLSLNSIVSIVLPVFDDWGFILPYILTKVLLEPCSNTESLNP